MGDDAVNALAGSDVLAERADVEVSEHGRVQSVPAQVWCGGGMCGQTRVLDVQLLHGDRVECGEVRIRGVHHHRHVHPFEGAGPDHRDLAAAPSSAGVPTTRTRPP
ncbi:MAG: hypothetical protein R2698_11495 [Microthrixaceae bacterium]